MFLDFKRIIDCFGDETLDVIRDNPEKLVRVKGVSEQKAISIHNQYIEQMGVSHVLSFLGQY